MGTDQEKRKNEWVIKFNRHISDEHPHLNGRFEGLIAFSPSVENPGVLQPGFNQNPVSDSEIGSQMSKVFEDFAGLNPV